MVRRLVVLVSAIVLLDTAFFSAITPLLPVYADRHDLSEGGAGVLSAAYPAGTLLAALPSGAFAARFGVRAAVLLGLGLLGASSLGFGLAHDVALLDAARFVQGVGGAMSWAGGLAWLVRTAPAQRRGELIGTAFGAAVFGSLLGPVLGALARAVGPEPVFGGVIVPALGLAVISLRTPAPAGVAEGGTPVWPALGDSRLRAGLALTVLVGAFFGLLEVLVPLRLDAHGARGALVAGTFLVSAGLQALASPWQGRWSDRAGNRPVTRLGLVAGVAVAVALAPDPGLAPMVVLGVLAGATVGALYVPGLALTAAGSERAGLDQGYGFALSNLAWAGAQVVGSAVGAGVAERLGVAVPYVAIAAVFAAALLGTRTRTRAPD